MFTGNRGDAASTEASSGGGLATSTKGISVLFMHRNLIFVVILLTNPFLRPV